MIDVRSRPFNDGGRAALRASLRTQRAIVCVGSGGVGKTTVAATIGLVAAALGRRTLVITIDPARRLANALGLAGLTTAPHPVSADLVDEVAHAVGGEARGRSAPLSAMMLDLQSAWDDMIARTAPDAATAKKILANRFYRALSRDLPGAHEFIACEALHHLLGSGAFDLVVLDTPPTQNALDFLDAPSRILDVLDNEAFRAVAQRSARVSSRLFDAPVFQSAAGTATSILSRFTGPEMLDELQDFLVLLRDLFNPLSLRTRELIAQLGSDDARFVVVTAPSTPALAEARFWLLELDRRRLRTAAAVANRIEPHPGIANGVELEGPLDALLTARGLSPAEREALLPALEEATHQQGQLATRESSAVDALVSDATVPVVRVPRLQDPGDDAKDLARLAPWLVGPGADVR